MTVSQLIILSCSLEHIDVIASFLYGLYGISKILPYTEYPKYYLLGYCIYFERRFTLSIYSLVTHCPLNFIMQISTFELLVQPIAPKPFNSNVSRRVIQAYFLTIANVDPIGSDDVVLSLQFTATPDLKNKEIFTIIDTGSGNVFGELSTDDTTGKPSQQITLQAGKSALFVLQPDISKSSPNPASLAEAKLEVRGYVEVFLSNLSPKPSANLLVSPQVRGTFVPNDLSVANPDFDQQAYSLPTPSGGSQITLP